MKRIATFVLIMLLFVPIAETNVSAKEVVATIYFGGTQCEWHGWNAGGTLWLNNHESVAKLHYYQRANPWLGIKTAPDITPIANHYKHFLDGIGASPCAPGVQQNEQIRLPWEDRCRSWEQIQAEARAFMDTIVWPQVGSTDTVVLNLIGFSRGCISAMVFADRCADGIDAPNPWGKYRYWPDKDDQIKRINILVFEPVAGDEAFDWRIRLEDFSLNKKVSHFVGLYARDERSLLFAPTIPAFKSNDTIVLKLLVPGTHETLVGNMQVTGKSTYKNPETDLRLMWVHRVSESIAVELLSLPEWGGWSLTHRIWIP